MMEYYLKEAEEASEKKDVILYFDEAELCLINEISAGKGCFNHSKEILYTKSDIYLDI